MDPLLSEFLGVVLRWLLTSVGTYLVAHHVIAAADSERYATAFAHDAVRALPMLAALLWGLWAKYKGRVRFLTALEAPPGTTEQGVKARINNGLGASVKTEG